MNFTYWLLLSTFLLFPFLGLLLSELYLKKWFATFLKTSCIFLFVHNLFYFFRYSVVGDHFDYTIFSFEYLVVCIGIASIRKTDLPQLVKRSLWISGIVLEGGGILIGLIGIILFIPISSSLEPEKVFTFQQNNERYTVRMYEFGFATLENSRYTFDTYRTYNPFPFERNIDVTDLFDTKTKLNLDNNLQFSIHNDKQKQFLTITSTNGESYLKELK